MKTLIFIFFFAFLIRLFLVPISAGWDFNLFEKAAELTLEGKNIYNREVQLHDLPYPYGGQVPLAYPPVFIYVLTPFKYISQRIELFSGFSFLGKLPSILSDLAIGYIIFMLVARIRERKTAFIASGLFLFNPLVIYNSSLYGRFDSVVLLFLLLSIINFKKTSSPIFQGIAIGLKTFPLFILPGLIIVWAGARIKKAVFAIFIPSLLSLPYIILDSVGFLFSVFLLHATKPARGLTWQYWMYDFNELVENWTDAALARNQTPLFISTALFVIFCALSVFLAVKLLRPPHAQEKLIFYSGIVLVLFPLFNKIVFEQYILWSLPFLLLIFFQQRAPAALVIFITYSISGTLINEFVRFFFTFRPWWWIVMALTTIFCVTILVKGFLCSNRNRR